MSFRHYRIFFLLVVLLLVVWDRWLDRRELTAWNHPLRIAVYPIAADGSAAAKVYVSRLHEHQFDNIERLVKRQAAHYGLSLDQPLDFFLAPELNELPPQPPVGGNVLQVMWWNFKARRWAGKVTKQHQQYADINAFVQFYDHQVYPQLNHSVGVEQGRMAIVNLYATRAMAGSNDMILLHEVLHTLGASDKYDLTTNQPLHPHGYAMPQQQPLHPQQQAEVMAGRIPLSEHEAQPPDSLSQVIIGPETAREIGWL